MKKKHFLTYSQGYERWQNDKIKIKKICNSQEELVIIENREDKLSTDRGDDEYVQLKRYKGNEREFS